MANRHTPHTYLPPPLVAPAALVLRSRRGPTARVGAITRTSGFRLTVAALALIGVGAAPAAARAAFPGDNGLIAFASDPDGDDEIVTSQGDGETAISRTNNTADDYGPSWSPDRAGGGCRRATRHNRRGRRCSDYANAGSFSRPATAGTNRIALTGQIAGRALRPGSYRLSLTAIGAGGARSRPQRIHFTVSPPPRARPSR